MEFKLSDFTIYTPIGKYCVHIHLLSLFRDCEKEKYSEIVKEFQDLRATYEEIAFNSDYIPPILKEFRKESKIILRKHFGEILPSPMDDENSDSEDEFNYYNQILSHEDIEKILLETSVDYDTHSDSEEELFEPEDIPDVLRIIGNKIIKSSKEIPIGIHLKPKDAVEYIYIEKSKIAKISEITPKGDTLYIVVKENLCDTITIIVSPETSVRFRVVDKSCTIKIKTTDGSKPLATFDKNLVIP